MLVDITLQQHTRPVNVVFTITRNMFQDINKHLFDKVRILFVRLDNILLTQNGFIKNKIRLMHLDKDGHKHPPILGSRAD